MESIMGILTVLACAPLASPPHLAPLADAVRRAAERAGIGVEVAVAGDMLSAGLGARTFSVHAPAPQGTWSPQAVEIQGPDPGGFLLRAILVGGVERAATDRPEVEPGSGWSALGAEAVGPYFTTWRSATSLDRASARLEFDLACGDRADPWMGLQLRDAIVAECVNRGWKGAPNPDPQLGVLADVARAALLQEKVAAQVSLGAGTLTLAWRPRLYPVLEESGDGRFGTALRHEIGPDHEGFIITVTAHDGPFEEAERRPEARAERYLLGAVRRRPYFQIFPSHTALTPVGRHLRVNIAMGSGQDIAVVRRVHLALLQACAERGWVE
jgi:hypothetical protein